MNVFTYACGDHVFEAASISDAMRKARKMTGPLVPLVPNVDGRGIERPVTAMRGSPFAVFLRRPRVMVARDEHTGATFKVRTTHVCLWASSFQRATAQAEQLYGVNVAAVEPWNL